MRTPSPIRRRLLLLVLPLTVFGCLPSPVTPETSGATSTTAGRVAGGPRKPGAPLAFGQPSYPSPQTFGGPASSEAPIIDATDEPSPDDTDTSGGTSGGSSGGGSSGGGSSGGSSGPSPVPSVAPPVSYFLAPTLGAYVTTYLSSGVSGFPDQTLANIFLDGPHGVCWSTAGSAPGVYFTDSRNNAVRAVFMDDAGVKTLETISSATIGARMGWRTPRGITLDADGRYFVVDSGAQTVRIGEEDDSGTLAFRALAGSGSAGYQDAVGANARFNNPWGVVVDVDGNAYVTDTNNHCIRKITPAAVVTTLCGDGTAGTSDGAGKSARFHSPTGIAIDTDGVMWVADEGNHLIRRVTRDGIVSTFAGSGTAGFKNDQDKLAQFNQPRGITVAPDGSLYVAELGNQGLRKITAAGAVSTFAGTDDHRRGDEDGPGTLSRFDGPRDLTVDPETGDVYLGDADNNLIRKIQPLHAVTTVAGKGRPLVPPADANNPAIYPTNASCCDGPDTAGFLNGDYDSAQFNEPGGVVVDNAYNLFVADTENHAIRKITPDGTVTTLAGNGVAGADEGQGAIARFNQPRGLAIDGSGNLYVADSQNHRIRKVTSGGLVTTVAGNGTAGLKNGAAADATFNRPSGVVVDAAGNLFVADTGNHVIREITKAGQVLTYAGTGVAGFVDDAPAKARFSSPTGLALDAKGALFIADYGNSCIRRLGGGQVTTFSGTGSPGWVDGGGGEAQFNNPFSLTIDRDGALYVTDTGNSLIRRVAPDGSASYWAGFIQGYPDGALLRPLSGYSDGPAIGAAFAAPAGICVDAKGYLYVSDTKNHRLRKIH